MILTLFTTYRTHAKVELLTHMGPYLLLLGDMLFNRIWMPLGQMSWYVFADYMAAAVYALYMAPGYPQLSPAPELEIFKMKHMWLAYSLPFLVLAANYLLQVIKFGLLAEGDLSDETSWFAISNISNTLQNMRS